MPLLDKIISLEDNSPERKTLPESDTKNRCDRLDDLISKSKKCEKPTKKQKEVTEKLIFIKKLIAADPKPFELVFPKPGQSYAGFVDRLTRISTAFEYIEDLTDRENEEYVRHTVILVTTVLIEITTRCTGPERDRKRTRHMMQMIKERKGELPRIMTYVQNQFIDGNKLVINDCSEEVNNIKKILGTHNMIIPTTNVMIIPTTNVISTRPIMPMRLTMPTRPTTDLPTTEISPSVSLEVDTQKETVAVKVDDEIDVVPSEDEDDVIIRQRTYKQGVSELATLTGTQKSPTLRALLFFQDPDQDEEEHCKMICDLGFENNRFLCERMKDVFNPEYKDDEQTARERRQAWENKGYEKKPVYDLEHGWHCITTETSNAGDEKDEKDNKEEGDDDDHDDDDHDDKKDERSKKRARSEPSNSPSRNTRSQTASPLRSGSQRRIVRRCALDFLKQLKVNIADPIQTSQ